MKRRLLEDSLQQENAQLSKSSTIVRGIETPSMNDILIGGKIFSSHIGNLRLRKLATDKMLVYKSSPFAEKQLVRDEMV